MSKEDISMIDSVKLRSEIEDFAKEMELALRRHDSVRGSGWKTASHNYLLGLLEGHLIKMRHRFHMGPQQTMYDMADIGNFAMMLWWLAKNRIKQEDVRRYGTGCESEEPDQDERGGETNGG
jgi:hypothetical protein